MKQAKKLANRVLNAIKSRTPKPIKSNVLFIVDAGHGGLHPETGEYVTPGKRMVKDGIEFYEGVNNRDNVERIIKELNYSGLEAVELCPTWRDVSLSDRCKQANAIGKKRETVLISIHSNAAGNGKEWHSATGIDTFIYTNASNKSKKLAKITQERLISYLGHWTKDRGVKERNFAILRETNMPAILVEGGFHTNENEVKLILSEEWKEEFTKAIVSACVQYNNSL